MRTTPTTVRVPPLLLAAVLALGCASTGPATAATSRDGRVVQEAGAGGAAEGRLAAARPDPWASDPFVDDLFPEPVADRPRELALHEPPAGRILHFTGTMLGQADELDAYDEAVGAALEPVGHAAWVALEGTRGWKVDVQQLATALGEAQESGGLLQLSMNFSVGSSRSRRSPSSDYAVATTDEYDERIDEIADLIRVSGVRVLLRVGNELNGAWEGHHAYVFPKAYRKVVDRFRARHADNVAFVWCVVPHGDPDIFARGDDGDWKWFPGDDYVDWYGIDVFDPLHFSGVAGHGRAGADRFYQVTRRLLERARRDGKPVLVGECTPQGHLIPSGREDPRGEYADTIWQKWFRPFLGFLDQHAEIKAVTLLPLDWRKTSAWPDWGDARIHRNPALLDRWRDELSRPRWMHLPEVLTEPSVLGTRPERAGAEPPRRARSPAGPEERARRESGARRRR